RLCAWLERWRCGRSNRMRTALAVAIALLLSYSVADAGTPVAGFDDTLFTGSVSSPTAIAFLPDGRMLITDQGGDLDLSDGNSTTTLVTIPVCSGSEMGLLGVAVDPSLSTNGFIYLYRTDNSGGCGSATGRFNQVVRVTMGPGDT